MAAGVSVDIMSGLNDPANSALPQQPLNRYHVQILAPLMLIISDFLGLLVRTLTSTQRLKANLILWKGR
uniref:Uncharacterized protein n=1 Tax=Brassica oleracea TaxID=3712 RepID=A0A3P6BE97_BRAOL|nr:unnamed protein product [Brassica oleracea]